MALSTQARASSQNSPRTDRLFPHFASCSPSFLLAIEKLDRYATLEHAVVLIEGESGTGKSFLARRLHDRSVRAKRVFESIVLSTLDDNLSASELFGHVGGAYTDARQSRLGRFASAAGGTLFLDEIGKATPAVQRKLLHVVEHGEIWPVGADRSVRVDTRLVAATNVPLQALADRGGFLPDLVPRLAGFRVRIPPLRERREDIPALVSHFVAIRAVQCGYTAVAPSVAPSVLAALQQADWPYNVRQLDSAVQCLLVNANGSPELQLRHLDTEIVPPPTYTPLSCERVREMVTTAGSVAGAARALGVSRQTAYRYLAQG